MMRLRLRRRGGFGSGAGPAVAACLAAAVLGIAAGPSRGEGPSPSKPPTYHGDVASILQKNCQDCHRPGQVAPFALLTYDQARKRSADLVEVTSEKTMPPWPASRDFGGPFRDARGLSEAEVATIRAWAEAGCPEGDPAAAPAPREFPSDWPLGEPDLVLTMPEPYALGASGDDEFRVFVLPTDLPGDRWVRAVDFRPGNRRVVHHVIAAFDDSGRARERDAADPLPGYSSVGGFGDGVPIRAFLPIWTPGSRPRPTLEGTGYRLPRGADVLIQAHYHKSGKPETDATAIGLYFSDRPGLKPVHTGFVFPELTTAQLVKIVARLKAENKDNRRPSVEEMFRDVLVIPPGATDYEIRGNTKTTAMGRTLPRDILLTSVMPHMHWLGKDLTLTAVLPDAASTRVPLIRIDRWNFNWQGTYAFADPVRLPKGAWFEMVGHFDNSAANPANPSKPPQTVRWGNQTVDEMCLCVFEFVDADPADPGKPAPRAGGDAARDPSGKASGN